MKNLKRTSLLLALVGALAVGGCGGDDDEGAPIPADRAGLLEQGLDETERRLANGSAGACEDILNDTQPRIGEVLASLPADVQDRDALEQSFANLWEIVDRECEQRREQEQEAQPDPLPVPDETDTETIPEETDTTTDEERPPPEEEEEDGEETIPPGQDDELPPGQGGEIPGQGGGGGGIAPGEEGDE